jgi:starvation-inducible DNA-binding protein
MEKLVQALSVVLADSYTLYLKTQNYHWHVKGPNFKSLHILFEEQYMDLANAVDAIAERILTLGSRAPASYKEFEALKTIDEGDSSLDAQSMLKQLAADQDKMIATLNTALKAAQAIDDEGSVTLIGDRLGVHEKNRWMLKSSL